MKLHPLFGLLAITTLFPSHAFGEMEGSLTAGYSTQYEFRGSTLGDDLAETNLELTTEYRGFSIAGSMWYGSTNDANTSVDNEVDYTVSLSRTFGTVEVKMGYIFYSYPEASAANSQELFLSVSKDLYKGITATVTGYYDFDLVDGWFIYADLGKTFKINDQTSFSLNAGVGAYESYGGFADGMNHYYVKAAVAWTPKENLTISPYVKYTSLDSDYPAEFSAGSPGGVDYGDDNLIGGVTISVSF